jgi:hypothetical protein
MMKGFVQLLAMILGLTIIIVCICNYFAPIDTSNWEEITYVVRPNDTLWSIAEDYCPDGIDIREYIHEVKDANNINSNIYPGDKITIFIDGGK